MFTEADITPICGVYFLLRGVEIVYVGQSRDVHSRFASHRHAMKHQRGNSIVFDGAFFLRTQESERLQIERALLRALRPVFCNYIPTTAGDREAEILQSLGLDPDLVNDALIRTFNETASETPKWRTSFDVNQQLDMMKARAKGESRQSIARRYGVSPKQVAEIVDAPKSWEMRDSPARDRAVVREELSHALWWLNHKASLKTKRRRARRLAARRAHELTVNTTSADVCDSAHAPTLNNKNRSASQGDCEVSS